MDGKTGVIQNAPAGSAKIAQIYIEPASARFHRSGKDELVGFLRSRSNNLGYFDETEGGRWFVSSTPDGRGSAHTIFSRTSFVVMIDTFRSGPADLEPCAFRYRSPDES